MMKIVYLRHMQIPMIFVYQMMNYFEIQGDGHNGNCIWRLYNSFNQEMPTEYAPLDNQYRNTVLNIIEERDHNEGFCCYKVRRNGKKQTKSKYIAQGKILQKQIKVKIKMYFCDKTSKENMVQYREFL